MQKVSQLSRPFPILLLDTYPKIIQILMLLQVDPYLFHMLYILNDYY